MLPAWQTFSTPASEFDLVQNNLRQYVIMHLALQPGFLSLVFSLGLYENMSYSRPFITHK